MNDGKCTDKGCYTNATSMCGVSNSGLYKDCPCHICLIKMMCYDGCDEYRNYETEMLGVAPSETM